MLCIYLKQSIAIQAKEKNNITQDNIIFYRYKNSLHTLSGKEIYDLNIRELIEDIMIKNVCEEKDENNKRRKLKRII